MVLQCLDFEQPIAELEEKINELRSLHATHGMNIDEEIKKLEVQSKELTRSIFSNLKPFQVVQLARHPQRPYILDYIPRMFSDFDELHGDRHTSKGASIIGGIARLDEIPVMVIGHQKGRKTNEKIERNFGMGRPEDYWKALRLMEMAEKFHLPILTFIDTAGAYPGIEAEERNQSEAIARNLFSMSTLKTPIICSIIGEGGSGGALALGVGDRLLMLQYSIYSVISPEGCASILWKNAGKASEAAEALGVTANRIKKLGLIDEVVEEPLGGAHRNYDEIAARLKQTISKHLVELLKLPAEKLVQERYARLMSYGLRDDS
ncbi:MAG: acetyl-CoA carboxylase carboxyltransferase subunit alpha [Pseudomonadota bacterium]|nr:acetyl-CoA carboxylase carboxyltransferase subunit alpha [Gammaproteobacteria bacterium]MBU1558284.1 acetyl-CoA carboxylase carboxyltransferase subunit alpha [Gammaproteobacteria bacterium]MBU1628816.1 acetyl-CoA carboxylase carboxyltransferase subunit alpha [Gammaproteobacteria bacterium]MBU1926611.1 acetyl-CoA carboxylase carboxyltransferase subunit alpha [Gammaproteobacteria bacterium]MBU2545837.1 acetyl-CoA carboxylase carboxyltransferase subunit alpha [Gammaproteobacteria bacterium]